MSEIKGCSQWLGSVTAGLAVFLLVAAHGRTALADTPPPSRVARLTYAEGYVHIDRADNAAGDPAQQNMPLVQGQTVVTGDDGQAEVEFEDGSVARLTPNSSLSLAHLTADSSGHFNTGLALRKGLAYFELRAAPRSTYSVEAGGDIVSPAENMTVRVNLDEPPAAISVLIGTAHVERMDGYRLDVKPGETFRSDVQNAGRYFLTQEIAPDSWDQWNESRDQAALDAASTQTAARDGFAGSQGYGWSDLDANGSWYNVPGQGQVWQPNGGDSADFDPYGNGSWVWYPGGGYQWASAYSWGWTPFRCGGWSYWNSFGWGWTPNVGCGGFGFAGFGDGGYGWGGYGWGYGGGYGGYVNIVQPPINYPIRHLPGGGRPGGGVHPIIRIHETQTAPGAGGRPIAPPQTGFRRIAGTVATPIKPIGPVYTARGGSAVGASLQRDFPVDRTTHTPVLGVQPGGGGRQTFVNTGRVTAGAGNPGIPGDGRFGGSRPGLQPGTSVGGQPGSAQGYRPSVQPGLRPSGAPPQGSFAGPQGQSGSHSMQQQSPPHYSAPSGSSGSSGGGHQSYSAPSAPAMSHSAPASAPSSSGGSKK